MLFEQCFAGLPSVNARDLVASWRPAYGEWLGAQAAEGFDRTTTDRYLEEKDIALEEAKAGDRDPSWSLRHDAEAMSPGALRQAFALKGWTQPAPDHAHAMTVADWKASPWYRKEISFRPDMTATRARIMAENFDRRRYRDQLLARGNEIYDGAGDMALGFGAALLGSLPDPINFIPLGGGLAAARGAGTAGRALLAGARAGAAEGAISTALVDALVLPDLASRGEDAGFTDLALDTLAGGVLGSVFGAAGGLLARRAALRAGLSDAAPVRLAEATPAQELTPFDASPDGGLMARAGTADAAPVRPAEATPAQGPTPFDVSPDGGRNTDNDLLRQGWTAGDRRAVADAVALGMNDVADGRPVDVGHVLGGAGVVERIQWRMLLDMLERGEGFQDVNFGKLSPETKQAINAIRTEEGVSLLDGDDLIIPANVARKLHEKRVLMGKMSAEQVADMLLRIFHGEADFASATRYPHIQAIVALRRELSEMGFIGRNEKTGETVIKSVYRAGTRNIDKKLGIKNPSSQGGAAFPHTVDDSAASPFAAPRLSTVQSRTDEGKIFDAGDAVKGELGGSPVEGWRAKKGDPSNLPAQSMTGESGSPIRAEAAAPPVTSRLTEEGAGVNLHVEDMDGLSPDFSTAAEPPAPPRMAPDEARLAEAEALANQDEALRRSMDELEARGAADAEELAGARTDAESTEALGRETLNCAWTVEE